MLYSDASGVEHTDSGPHNSGNVIWSDESRFTLFQTTGCVYVWRTPKEAFAPECIVPTVKHAGGSLMVHPFVQTSFPGECTLYQDNNAPIHTAKIVQEWFAEHEGEVGHLDWLPQSPDLNIIEHLWGYLESKLRARFPPPSTISALETALHEEWLHISLQVVNDLYASIPRRIQSVIQSKGVQLPINKAFLLFHRAQKSSPDMRKQYNLLTRKKLSYVPFKNKSKFNRNIDYQHGHIWRESRLGYTHPSNTMELDQPLGRDNNMV
ncbi:transposable element Tcb1 transposase [Trichonephila clavipes]|nr:transposable element Tcb1 transposase [Trichonephila clavipes]